MHVTKIENALKEIEGDVPDGRHQVRFDVWGGSVDESFIRGPRLGLISMGVQLIRAALQEEKGKSINAGPILEDDLNDLIHPESTVNFDWIELSDELDAEPKVNRVTRNRLSKEKIFGWTFVLLVGTAFLIWMLRQGSG